ncbi:MAG: hypothetical protein WDN01_04480 [Rhizomicrobium sp.]
MKGLAPYLVPALALYFIVRRGAKPQRIKPDRLWIFPGIITFLALSAIWRGKAPGLLEIAVYVAAILAGGVLGWFTTQHVELTLDDATGTVMSQPTWFGTVLTAAVFVARFALDFLTTGDNGGGVKALAQQHGAGLVLVANAGLLFVAARGLSRAWHMVARINPLLEQHKAAQRPPE